LRGEIVRRYKTPLIQSLSEVSGGNTISAVITNECATSLELEEGDKVFAMFNASSVILGSINGLLNYALFVELQSR
jgi:molybdopterin-binding protein